MDESKGLVEAAARGEDGALDRLLERHLPGLRAFVRLRADKVLRSKESSSDLVQSVCREVLEHMDRFQYRSEAGFRQWLYRTAERKVVDRFRYYHAARRSPDREVEPGHDRSNQDFALSNCYRTIYTPSQDAIAKEELERVEEAFGDLSQDYRDVITMARIVGLTNSEIAEQLGRTEASVRNLLYRGLAQLADRVARPGSRS